jgi:hypothetical protein
MKDHDSTKISEFVIDSELIFPLIYSTKTENSPEKERYKEEGEIFYDILKKVSQRKYVVLIRSRLMEDYETMLPENNLIKRYFFRSINSSYRIVEKKGVTPKKRDSIKEVIGEKKAEYIEIATQCENYPLLISTNEYIENNYITCFKNLIDIEVHCSFKNVFEFLQLEVEVNKNVQRD